MSVEKRQSITQTLPEITRVKGSEHKVWTNSAHIMTFTKFVPLGDINRLRICCQVAQDYPGVIMGSRKDDIDDTKSVNLEKKKDPPLKSFLLLPPNLVETAKKEEAWIRQRRSSSNISSASATVLTTQQKLDGRTLS